MKPKKNEQIILSVLENSFASSFNLNKINMETSTKPTITVENTVNASAEKVWNYFTSPEHIVKWNQASDDWHTTRAENDLRAGGKFLSRMEAKDGSFGFDFGGEYDEIKTHQLIAYTMGDGRKAKSVFTSIGNNTKVTTTFEAETQNPIEMQKTGWQAILDCFRKYVESN
jgi:uncharacterized protein YndB with AHSA1/START domain